MGEHIPNVLDRNCPTRLVATHVTSHWGSLVLRVLTDGTMRFSELRRAIDGVSEKMLAQTLQQLERDGLVHREVHPVIPPHVDYSLTPFGVRASAHIRALFELIQDNIAEVMTAQVEYDTRRAS
jgi:DNA-binding HxlR family transcriptional regulator